MVTVNGQIADSEGNNLACYVDFKPLSTPQFLGGVAVVSDTVTVQTDPSDGTFTVNLEPGVYGVTVRTAAGSTTFNISVVDGTSPVDINDIVSSPVQPLPGVPPNTLFNGLLAGNLTFLPVADPAAPTTAPVQVAGGAQGAGDAFKYEVVWQTATGTSKASADSATSTAPVSPNNATRVTFAAPPTGVTAVLIYRSNDGTANRYLLASVAPAAGHYDDFESQANFAARLDPTQTPPTSNTTAGGLVPNNTGSPAAAWVTSQGLQLNALVFMVGTNMRIKPGYGIQLYNPDTGLWHTLLSFGNPAQLAQDAGMT